MNQKVEKVRLHYIKKNSENTPVVNYSGDNESQGYSNEYVFIETDITDARTLVNKEFNLDKEGFKLTHFIPEQVNYSLSEDVKKIYYPEVESLVREQTGASDVFVFDHTVRRGLANSNRRPAYHIHNDYTYDTGLIRPRSVLGDDIMDRFAGKRMVQINVWRSISGEVEKDPLALMDAKTLDQNDLVRTEIKFNDMNTGETHNGEIFALKKNPNQKWFYF